jgi:hypothetical protein
MYVIKLNVRCLFCRLVRFASPLWFDLQLEVNPNALHAHRQGDAFLFERTGLELYPFIVKLRGSGKILAASSALPLLWPCWRFCLCRKCLDVHSHVITR